MRKITDDEIAFFDANGYVICRGVLHADELENFRAERVIPTSLRLWVREAPGLSLAPTGMVLMDCASHSASFYGDCNAPQPDGKFDLAVAERVVQVDLAVVRDEIAGVGDCDDGVGDASLLIGYPLDESGDDVDAQLAGQFGERPRERPVQALGMLHPVGAFLGREVGRVLGEHNQQRAAVGSITGEARDGVEVAVGVVAGRELRHRDRLMGGLGHGPSLS